MCQALCEEQELSKAVPALMELKLYQGKDSSHKWPFSYNCSESLKKYYKVNQKININ